jgi:predicted nucleotidyltransferase component of viral defense system
MLHKETVEPRTLELLKELMQLNALKDFALLGGTSLSLRWGHRISEDIDLFSNIMFDEVAVTEAITNHFSNTIVLAQDKQTLRLFIENVKVELLAPKRPYLKPIEEIENIRFFSVADAMAFKMNAIERRGSRKDFYDLNEALQYHSLQELIEFYCQKFTTHDPIHLVKSINYFADADTEPEFKSFKKETWNEIKENIAEIHKKYLLSRL